MAKQNEPEQLDLFKIDPVCKSEGCMHQQHFRTIRNMQAEIFKLQEEIRGYKES